MDAKATLKTIHITPRKVRLVIDVVRGKGVNDALAILDNTRKGAAPVVAKLVRSAVANATNNFQMDACKLYIKEIHADDSIRMKRFMPRAKGSSSGLLKRTSHITVVVSEKE